MNFPILNLPSFSDKRGNLTVIQDILPFDIARVYWIYGADSHVRGGHRHHKTRQALIAINGEIQIYMNDGISHDTIMLDSPHQCLLVEPKDWHTMTFGVNSILLVMSSERYNASDYIDAPYS